MGFTLCRCLVFLELSEEHGWYKLDYANSFDISLATVKDNLERVDVKTVSVEEFVEKYEKPYKPCVIVNAQNHWLANIKWTKEVRWCLFCGTKQHLGSKECGTTEHFINALKNRTSRMTRVLMSGVCA